MFDLFIETAHAQGTAAAQGPSTMEMLILPLGFVFIMYFLIIRPQQKKAKQHQALLKGLKAGDEVVTQGGLIGRVRSVAETFITVDIASSTSVKVLKTHVVSLTKPKTQPVAPKAAKSKA